MARRKQKRTRRKPQRKRAGHRRNIARMRTPAKNPFRSPYNMNLQSLEIIRENNRRTQEEFAKAWDSKNMSQSQAWENKAVEAMADLRRARAESKLLAARSLSQTPATQTPTPSQNPAPGSPPQTDIRPSRGVVGEVSEARGARLRDSAEAIRGGIASGGGDGYFSIDEDLAEPDVTIQPQRRGGSPHPLQPRRRSGRSAESIALHGIAQE